RRDGRKREASGGRPQSMLSFLPPIANVSVWPSGATDRHEPRTYLSHDGGDDVSRWRFESNWIRNAAIANSHAAVSRACHEGHRYVARRQLERGGEKGGDR